MMTDNRQLQTSRLLNTNAGNLIDDSFADLEAAVRYIFGITADTPYSRAMSIDADGNVTLSGQLTLAGAPTADLHAATKKYADDNAGSGGIVSRCVVTEISSSTEPTGSSFLAAKWQIEVADTDGWWTPDGSGESSRITVDADGTYLVGFSARCLCDVTKVFGVSAELYKNGASIRAPFCDGWTDDPWQYGFYLGAQTLLELSADDYLEVYLAVSGLAGSEGVSVQNGACFWVMRVG